MGGGDAGDGVGHARTGRHQTDAGLQGRARIRVSSVDGGLFVAHQDVTERVLLKDFVVDVEHCAAGVAEHVLDTLFTKATDNDFCAIQLHLGTRGD